MAVELAGLLGLLTAMVVFSALMRWVVALKKTYTDYRIAADHPHLRQPKRPWIFPLLLVLHSGSWVLALTVFGAVELFTSPYHTWHAWFVGGFIAYVALMAYFFILTYKNRQSRHIQH